MKLYDIFIHYKQGDDFNHHLEKTKSTAEAFSSWADSFKAAEDVCRQVSAAFAKAKVTTEDIAVDAQVHSISFNPLTEKGEGLLKMLVAEELLHVEDFDDGEEDEGGELGDEAGSDSET